MSRRLSSQQNRRGDPNGFARGDAPFFPPDISGLVLWLRSDTGITYVQGPVVAAGTTPPAVTITGTPSTPSTTIEIDITVTGVLGVALFSWKLNTVVQQTLQVTAANFALGTTGLTAHFPSGTYTNDNVFTSVVTVSNWADLSPNGWNAVQATPANQPAYSYTGGPNGTPALSFLQASNQFMNAASVNISQPDTIFVVAKFTSNVATFAAIDGNTARQAMFDSTGTFTIFAGGTSVGGAVVDTTAAHLYVGIFSGAASKNFTDNTQSPAGSGNTGANALNNMALGGISGNRMTGLIMEVAIYNSSLNSQQMATFAAYIKSRYGIATS